MENKIIKQVKEFLSKTKDNYDLRSAKRTIDNLFRWEEIKRNKTRAKIFKPGDKVEFYTPASYPGAFTLKGTIEKVGFRKIKIKVVEVRKGCTDTIIFNVPATKVGRPERVNAA